MYLFDMKASHFTFNLGATRNLRGLVEIATYVAFLFYAKAVNVNFMQWKILNLSMLLAQLDRTLNSRPNDMQHAY